MKWNMLDKLSTQVLYAVTGIVLARLISPAEFGLVGAVLVFQAFASLFVDSGFAAALIQRKDPTEQDYSSVFWFNMLMACGLYVLLYFTAPLIAEWNQGDMRLVPLARVMFITFILNAAGIVQTNRMVKQLTPRPVAIANCLGLALGGVVGIWLAVTRADAWALVWQQVVYSASRTALLWLMVRWRPMWFMSWRILRSFFAVGSGVMLQSFLNTIFLKIYAFIIGNRLGFAPLGIYTQAEKWSTMASASVSQVLTSSFLPALSAVQDQPARLANMTRTVHRSAATVVFPAFGWAIIAATPIFHLLFGSKWDAAIPLFQIFMGRGILVVLVGLYCNYMLSVGRAKLLVVSEVVRDAAAIIALVATLPWLAAPGGLELMLWGQFAATAITFVVTLCMTAPCIHRTAWAMLLDLLPPLLPAALTLLPALWLVGHIATPLWAILASVILPAAAALLALPRRR